MASRDPHAWTWRAFRALATVLIIAVTIAAAEAKPPADRGKGGDNGSCNGRKKVCSPSSEDTEAPTIAIEQPADGHEMPSSLTVTGTASDNVGVRTVTVRVDDGPFVQASGTDTWSVLLDALDAGPHTITARATDDAGNWADATVSFTVGADGSLPTLTITTPAAGATVPPVFSVRGSATDEGGLSSVDVRVDGGAYRRAQGTTDWSLEISDVPPGPHDIVVRAVDTAGNVATASLPVIVAEPTDHGDIVATSLAITNPTSGDLRLLGGDRLARRGDLTGSLYWTPINGRFWLYLRDASTGARRSIELPTDSSIGWGAARYAFDPAGDLWVLGGGGPPVLHHYRLTGSPVPDDATLVSKRSFGDRDSRVGDLLITPAGAVIALWHQQGSSGPQGHHVAYRAAGETTWRTTSFSFMPTHASRDELVRHPADGAIWLFTNPDGWSAIGAARLVEADGRLRVDKTDPYFIDGQGGTIDADPENPDLAAAVDHQRNEIVLAYQSAERKIFSASPFVAGSHPALARIAADGRMTFLRLPIYVERVSRLALAVQGEAIWLGHRPIDPQTLTFDQLHVSRHDAGAWTTLRLGTLTSRNPSYEYATDRPELTASMSDGVRHHILS